MATMAKSKSLYQRAVHNWLPVVVVLLAVVLAWYGAAWALNAPGAIERVLDEEAGYTQMELNFPLMLFALRKLNCCPYWNLNPW